MSDSASQEDGICSERAKFDATPLRVIQSAQLFRRSLGCSLISSGDDYHIFGYAFSTDSK